MNEAIKIAEVNRKAFLEKWKPGKASELIFAIRAKYDIIYLNRSKNDNETRTQTTPNNDGMEGG